MATAEHWEPCEFAARFREAFAKRAGSRSRATIGIATPRLAAPSRSKAARASHGFWTASRAMASAPLSQGACQPLARDLVVPELGIALLAKRAPSCS
jgi:hypothetical protein